jgi:hypothetical protein
MNQTRKEPNMRARLTKVTVVVMGLAALAFGGASLAGAAGKSSPSKPAVVQDRDSIQQGDQTAPDNGAAEKADPAEKAGSEAAEPAEKAGSESAAESDGPGGHADEPGNPNADNQFEGEQ